MRKDKQVGKKNIPFKILPWSCYGTKDLTSQVKTFLLSHLCSMFWPKSESKGQETLVQETNMWVLCLRPIHVSREDKSTRQKEGKLWVTSKGGSLSLLTCKKQDSRMWFSSSVLAMLSLCRDDPQTQTPKRRIHHPYPQRWGSELSQPRLPFSERRGTSKSESCMTSFQVTP